jgi:flagellar assembly protein FliH
MKPWREPIRLSQPLRDVSHRATGAVADFERVVREHEQSAFERGRLEGERSLGEQLVRQRSELLEIQQGVVESLRQALPKVIHESEQALVELALETARRLVASLEITPAMIEGAIREALTQVEPASGMTVRLHPDDLALLERINAGVLNDLLGGEPLKFSCSPEVTRGGCIVETRFGMLDGRRETKLLRIRQALGMGSP